MTAERLQKILARAGIASRRESELLIRQGRVTVNGSAATLGQRADPEIDAIKVDGRRIRLPQRHRYFLLNKPKGYISTRSDPEGRPTVLDLIAPRHRKALVPVGRLDLNSEGLLLLTDDGEFVHRVAHPRFGCSKTYRVKVRGVPEQAALERLRGGIVLGRRRTAPARIQPERLPSRPREGGNSWWRVEIGEGRTRQVREMFARVGHPVIKLRRVAIGPLTDPRLPAGSYRELSRGEVEALLGRRRRKPAKGSRR